VSSVVLLDKVRGQLETLRLTHTTEILDATLQETAEEGLAGARGT
jgi:hypothetical protein